MAAVRACCVVGGNGFVGSRLVARLAGDGVAVLVPTRHPERCGDLRVLPAVRLVQADVHAPGVLEAGRVSVTFGYHVRRGDEALANGFTTHCYLSPEGRPIRPPAFLAGLLASAPPAVGVEGPGRR